MKRVKRPLLAAVLVLGMTSPIWAARGTHNIAATPHNLSTSSTIPMYQSTNEDEICIFCHTPHGGSLTGQLWNKEDPDPTSYSHYTSATLSSEVATSRAGNVSPESLLCLSCHDGSISMYNVKNISNGTGVQPSPNAMLADGKMFALSADFPGGYLGTDLTNDHPISFSYTDVRNDGRMDFLIDPALIADVRLFGATNRVECSSCHDPHVDYIADSDYRPFLVTPNTGSALCLACHIK